MWGLAKNLHIAAFYTPDEASLATQSAISHRGWPITGAEALRGYRRSIGGHLCGLLGVPRVPGQMQNSPMCLLLLPAAVWSLGGGYPFWIRFDRGQCLCLMPSHVKGGARTQGIGAAAQFYTNSEMLKK